MIPIFMSGSEVSKPASHGAPFGQPKRETEEAWEGKDYLFAMVGVHKLGTGGGKYISFYFVLGPSGQIMALWPNLAKLTLQIKAARM